MRSKATERNRTLPNTATVKRTHCAELGLSARPALDHPVSLAPTGRVTASLNVQTSDLERVTPFKIVDRKKR
jgi:hypothetical protein